MKKKEITRLIKTNLLFSDENFRWNEKSSIEAFMGNVKPAVLRKTEFQFQLIWSHYTVSRFGFIRVGFWKNRRRCLGKKSFKQRSSFGSVFDSRHPANKFRHFRVSSEWNISKKAIHLSFRHSKLPFIEPSRKTVINDHFTPWDVSIKWKSTKMEKLLFEDGGKSNFWKFGDLPYFLSLNFQMQWTSSKHNVTIVSQALETLIGTFLEGTSRMFIGKSEFAKEEKWTLMVFFCRFTGNNPIQWQNQKIHWGVAIANSNQVSKIFREQIELLVLE